MPELPVWLTALPWLLAVGTLTWILSVVRRNVTIVDALWPLLFVVAALAYARSAPAPGPRTTLVVALFGLWGVGLYFEAVGDWQLARFKQDPASAGRVMDRGLWAWTRHPNYFGERRPGYAEYVRRTNAFIPGSPRH